MIGPLAHWPADTSVALDERPVGRVLADHAAATPDHPAVRWLEHGQVAALSYRGLTDGALGMAARLLARLDPGQRVAVAATTSVDWLLLEYGAALAGTPLVPVNPALTDPEIEHILVTSEARFLLADETYRGSPVRARLAGLVGRLGLGPVVRLGDWRELPGRSGELAPVDPAGPFLVQYTSGTTGRPKGAVLSHRAALNCAALSMARLGATSADNWLNVMPMHHVGGSVSVALAVLAVGATITLVPAFEPGPVLELLERTRATILGAVPTMQLALLDHPAFPSTDLSSLRLLQSGGTVVPTSLIRRAEAAFGVTVVNAYGQSESPNALMTSPDDDEVTKAETIGTPLPQREVRIVGPDGTTLAVGQRGEMVMRSPMVMDGYVGVDGETAARTLTPDGWLHTGDLCSMDERGVIRIHGRLRDVIIRGGENIYPAEVEEVMLGHPGVAEIAVVGVDDDHWGEVPVAVYRATPGADPAARDLQAHARASLASFKVPRRWIRVEAFPLTASGKIKKFELRAGLGGSTRSESAPAGPSGNEAASS